ncbi:MAG TPA: M24 family metallopeptidase [Pseudothermotoga sp.]|nr:M24 family metallopeptidase [Pseudothermotoga sp.]
MLRSLFKARVDLLRGFVEQRGFDGIVLSRCDNFSWFTFGARNHITLNTEVGTAHVFVNQESVYIFTNNIERKRIEKEEMDEEISSQVEFGEYLWSKNMADVLKPFISGKKIVSDTGMLGTVDLKAQIDLLRYAMSDFELKTYQDLGAACDEVLNRKMKELKPDMTELEVHGIVYSSLAKEGIEPIFVMVSGEESANLYRHNLPRNVRLGKKVFVSICARKRGLVVSATRSVLFEKDQALIDQHKQNCYIDAVAISNSKVGVKLSTVFEQIKKAYAEVGKPYEWMLHHQGGLAGYNAREIIANELTDYELRVGNVVAWNPTITGTKSEDTVALTQDGVKIISYYEKSDWPCVEFKMNGMLIRRPDLLVVRRG